DLVIVEALGLQTFGDVGEAAELVAGLRQIGAAVAAVDREIIARLEDQAEARRPQVVAAAELARARWAEVIDIHPEAVDAQPGNDLEPCRGPDLVLHISGGDSRLDPIVRIAWNWRETHDNVLRGIGQ